MSGDVRPIEVLGEYWGLRAMSVRMGYSGKCTNTMYRLIVQEHFLAYKRRKPGRHIGAHQWYTNDQLILAWEMAKCSQQREQLISEHEAKQTTLIKRCGKMREKYGPTGVKFTRDKPFREPSVA